MGENDNIELKDENSESQDEIVDIGLEEDKEIEDKDFKEKKIEISESEYLDLKKKVEDNKKLAEANFERLQRAQAEFENYKKILDKQKQEFVCYAEKGIILKLLNIIDEFEIILNGIEKETEKDKIIQGIRIIYNKLIDFLKNEEVKPIESVGKPFDPFLHEVLLNEKTDEYPEDTVIEEIKKGYYLKDKILRHALVKIAKNK